MLPNGLGPASYLSAARLQVLQAEVVRRIQTAIRSRRHSCLSLGCPPAFGALTEPAQAKLRRSSMARFANRMPRAPDRWLASEADD